MPFFFASIFINRTICKKTDQQTKCHLTAVTKETRADLELGMDVVTRVWEAHQNAPARIKAIDLFMVFTMCVGIVQFMFCVLVGNYPFNAFLGGFASAVGQFVLLAGLRQQINPANASEFEKVGPKRAFGDFIFGSLILHFLVFHFIN